MNGHSVVLSIGSNDGEAASNVHRALARLGEVLADSCDSGSYNTPPLSGQGSEYVNAVISGHFTGSPDVLESLCKRLEVEFGRDEKARAAKRVPLDVDVVMVDGEVVRPKDFGYGYFQTGYLRLQTQK